MDIPIIEGKSHPILTPILSLIPLSLWMNSVVDLAFSDSCWRFCDNSVWNKRKRGFKICKKRHEPNLLSPYSDRPIEKLTKSHHRPVAILQIRRWVLILVRLQVNILYMIKWLIGLDKKWGLNWDSQLLDLLSRESLLETSKKSLKGVGRFEFQVKWTPKSFGVGFVVAVTALEVAAPVQRLKSHSG